MKDTAFVSPFHYQLKYCKCTLLFTMLCLAGMGNMKGIYFGLRYLHISREKQVEPKRCSFVDYLIWDKAFIDEFAFLILLPHFAYVFLLVNNLQRKE